MIQMQFHRSSVRSISYITSACSFVNLRQVCHAI